MITNFSQAVGFYQASIDLDQHRFETFLGPEVTATYERTEDGKSETIELNDRAQIINRYYLGLFKPALMVVPESVTFDHPKNLEGKPINTKVMFECFLKIAYKEGNAARFHDTTTLSFNRQGLVKQIHTITVRVNF